MTPKPIAVWHDAVARGDLADFEALLADDAVFHSPALHKPRAGKALVSMYLRGAMMILKKGGFHYTGEWIGERSAVLEFEAEVDGLAVNGVDIIHWNDDDRVTHFKVMVRPYKGLTALMAAMAKLLDQT